MIDVLIFGIVVLAVVLIIAAWSHRPRRIGEYEMRDK
jgi:hypothetical protein